MRVRRTFLGEDEDEDEGKHEMRVIRVMMRAMGGGWTSMVDVGAVHTLCVAFEPFRLPQFPVELSDQL